MLVTTTVKGWVVTDGVAMGADYIYIACILLGAGFFLYYRKYNLIQLLFVLAVLTGCGSQ